MTTRNGVNRTWLAFTDEETPTNADSRQRIEVECFRRQWRQDYLQTVSGTAVDGPSSHAGADRQLGEIYGDEFLWLLSANIRVIRGFVSLCHRVNHLRIIAMSWGNANARNAVCLRFELLVLGVGPSFLDVVYAFEPRLTGC